jgi:hypothetical protein
LHIREANEFVKTHQRHSLPTIGGKWAIGAAVEGKLVGVAIAGRPVAWTPVSTSRRRGRGRHGLWDARQHENLQVLTGLQDRETLEAVIEEELKA